ncbi:unnamed protein product [Blepharisma stoltei]|uniref:Transmembrane protein n=1 Tax=Blepharisma stoltei TaxID=1481888 RepID=A0AAU9IDI1_9CILI|nr:unnamed protein product [Blepharisma stoltei]CAG9319399.1 unnamed protein product [Blepharisma stoltei]
MAVVAIDFFQFISQGPDIGWLFFWLSRICSYSITNFDYSVGKSNYWIYLYTAMIISCYWVFSACALIFNLNKLDGWLLKYVRIFATLLLPIIGNIVFVPMVSVFLSIFQCDEGTSNQISDSFIRHDCTTYCRNHKYILWAFFSLISLIMYIPLSIYFRYHYENSNDHINIRTKPTFILQKSVLQISIIAMSQTIKVYSQSLHGLCCSILLLIFILLCLKNSPYNYSRMNFWAVTSYFGVLYNFILSSIYWLTEFESQELWLSLQILVWATLGISGILIQWKLIPSLLLTAQPPDIAIFFRFSLGARVSAADINKLKKEIVQISDMGEEKLPNLKSQTRFSIEKDDLISE